MDAHLVTTEWSRLVRPSLLGVDPYDPGPSLEELRAEHGLDEIAKLNWNEGLLGPFPGVAEAVAAELENAWMYPEQAYSDFREAVAAWVGTRPERIVPGHGIQALIATVAHAFLDPGDPVVVPTPTYGLYAQVCAAAGARVERVPARGLRHDLEAVAAAARETGARLAWICDPNNPTGSLVSRDEWAAFLAALPETCAVVVDEAYVEYVDPARRLRREDDVEDGRPVLVLRTFSKIFGLAGLRLGYAIADERLASFLDVVQEPFNVNRAALAAGRASLARSELVEERRRENAAARGRLADLLREAGADPASSEANFVLADVAVDDVALADRLLRGGLLVRPGSEFGLDRTVRITVGPEALMERVAAELAEARAGLLAAAPR
ncbi:MAG TPA: histidinol-phosphate transaminase [Gaiellaceae bacterium]|nr:histidinol-phosphate transaminase [Gaiellaceae bacterium]